MIYKKFDLKSLIELKKYFTINTEMSEYVLGNLYLWSDFYQYLLIEDNLIIKYKNSDNEYFLYPQTKNDICDVIKLISENKNHLEFICLNEAMITTFKSIYGNKFNYEEESSRFDYIYDVQALIKLEGKAYHQKKNMLNRFIKNYNYEVQEINQDNAHNIKYVINQWCDLNDCSSDEYLNAERNGILNLIENWNSLKMKGIYITVENRVIAFSIGEEINPDIFLVHLEKADLNYSGAFQIINQEFLKSFCINYKYVNRECDLGIPGLRKAKESYKPVKILKKFKGIIKI